MPELSARGDIFTLQTLMGLDISRETDDRRVALFYTQAISLVDFLITTFGSASFTDFCRELRDGKSLEAALRSAYPHSLKSIEEMEDRWRDYLRGHRKPATEDTPEPVETVLRS